MQCPKINIFSFNNIALKRQNSVNNQYDYSRNKLFIPQNDVFVKKRPDISFTAIMSGGDLKNLVNRKKIHCIYCGRPMLSNKRIDELKKSGIFSAPIRYFAQEMFNYIDYLHPTEKEVLKKITLMAFDYPDIHLSEAIKKLYFKANHELLKEQIPILNQLYGLSHKIPQNMRKHYQNLIKISRYRLEEKSYIPDNFNAKEFVYKTKRICSSVKDSHLASKILKLSEPLTHPIFMDKMPLNNKFAEKILKLCDVRDVDSSKFTKKDLQLMLIDEMRKYAEILNRADIIDLCDTASKTIERKPVKVKFSNKSLARSLWQMLDEIPNNKVKQKILSLLHRLPNSETSTNAFIAKHQFADSEAIAYNLLRPSIVTIEHIRPKSLNGANDIANYALSCERDNGRRSNGDLSMFVIQFSKKNHQKYFDELIDEVKHHNLDKTTLLRMIKAFQKESGVIIDTSKLNSKG